MTEAVLERAKGMLRQLSGVAVQAEVALKALLLLCLPVTWGAGILPSSLAVRVLPPSTRRRVSGNLAAVFGGDAMGDPARVRRYFRQLFAAPLDFLLGLRMGPEHVERLFELQGREHLDEALERGRGVIGVTGHYSCAVRGLLAVGCLGYRLSAVVLQAENVPAWVLKGPFRALLRRVRRRTGVDFVFPGGAVSQVRDRIRNNEIVAFTLDVPRFDEAQGGLRVPFLGGEVTFPGALISLAVETDACLLPAFVLKRPGRPGHRIRAWPPVIPESRDRRGVREALTHCARILEARIRERPEDWWLWKDLMAFWTPVRGRGEGRGA